MSGFLSAMLIREILNRTFVTCGQVSKSENMLIKQAGLNFKVPDSLPALYVLLANDPWQLNFIAHSIISYWQKLNPDDNELKTIQLSTANDWTLLTEEAMSYSLFSTNTLIDASFEKKTLDAAGKQWIDNYLCNPNPQCLIIIRAPNLPLKQVQHLSTVKNTYLIAATLPDSKQIKQWIIEKLRSMSITADEQIPTLIHQYTTGNLLACAQLIDKFELIIDDDRHLTVETLQAHLSNQCEYQLFDLADTCLRGDDQKALQLLRQVMANKSEATLVLWILAQEIRQLLQLKQLINKGISFRDACSQLKIWSTRIASYQSAINKYDEQLLLDWLTFCSLLDKRIKSKQTVQLWHAFELLTLSLCSGKQVGYLA